MFIPNNISDFSAFLTLLTTPSSVCRALLIELLKGTAYRFTSGPWENVWFRHGYSPLAHPDARFLQVITVAPGASALEAVVKTASSQLGDRLSRTTLVNLHSLSVWDMPWGLHTKSGEAVDCFLFHEAFNRHTKVEPSRRTSPFTFPAFHLHERSLLPPSLQLLSTLSTGMSSS